MFIYNPTTKQEMLVFKADKLYFLNDKNIDDLACAICYTFENKLIEQSISIFNHSKNRQILNIVSFLMMCNHEEIDKLFNFLAIKNGYLYNVLDKLFKTNYRIHKEEIIYANSLKDDDELTGFTKHIANFLEHDKKSDDEKLISLLSVYNLYYFLLKQKQQYVEKDKLAFESYDHHLKYVIALSVYLQDF